MFKNPDIADHPLDFELYSLTANFEDSGGNPVGPTFVVDKLVAETGNRIGTFYLHKLLRNGYIIFDII